MFDLTYQPITGTGLPPERGTVVLAAAIDAKWVTAQPSAVDGRTLEIGFVGRLAARHRQEATRWLVDMSALIGLQLLEADGRTWTVSGWRRSTDQHPDLYIELTEEAGASLTTVITPTGDPVAYVPDPHARPVHQTDALAPHWRVYANGIVLPVNGARPPRSFPRILVANPVVAAFEVTGGVRLITQDGDTSMVPCGWRRVPQPPVVTVNTGQAPPNQSIPAPPTRGLGP